MSRSTLFSIYAEGGFTLAGFQLSELGCFEIRLLYASQFEKEGDLTLGLVECSSGLVWFSLTFTVVSDTEEGRELFIGGIQGNKLANKREHVATITRALHGLRPKALLVFVLRQLAIQWQVSRIRAVNNDLHIYRHWSYCNRRKRKTVIADYNRFWIECGGARGRDGMFSLPINVEARNVSMLKPNKRGMYRRRYELLTRLEKEIASHLVKTNSGVRADKLRDVRELDRRLTLCQNSVQSL